MKKDSTKEAQDDLAFREHESVSLRIDLPSAGLLAGDIGVIVAFMGPLIVVEFLNDEGETLALMDLDKAQVARLPHEQG